jgi:hypothetical protein
MAEQTVPFRSHSGAGDTPRVTLYSGGGHHPWPPGATVALPQSHAEALETSGHGVVVKETSPAKPAPAKSSS